MASKVKLLAQLLRGASLALFMVAGDWSPINAHLHVSAHTCTQDGVVIEAQRYARVPATPALLCCVLVPWKSRFSLQGSCGGATALLMQY